MGTNTVQGKAQLSHPKVPMDQFFSSKGGKRLGIHTNPHVH